MAECGLVHLILASGLGRVVGKEREEKKLFPPPCHLTSAMDRGKEEKKVYFPPTTLPWLQMGEQGGSDEWKPEQTPMWWPN